MELIKLLPDYYEENITMNTLQNILSGVTDDLDIGLSNTIRECFASTASALLSRYEKMYDLEIDVTKSETYRRERITAKLIGTGASTKEMIQEVAASYSNGEVDVIEDNANSKFLVKFVGTLGIPGNMADLKLTIEEIKPAHLAVEYEYTYNTWSDIQKLEMTWEQATVNTWNEIRTVNA